MLHTVPFADETDPPQVFQLKHTAMHYLQIYPTCKSVHDQAAAIQYPVLYFLIAHQTPFALDAMEERVRQTTIVCSPFSSLVDVLVESVEEDTLDTLDTHNERTRKIRLDTCALTGGVGIVHNMTASSALGIVLSMGFTTPRTHTGTYKLVVQGCRAVVGSEPGVAHMCATSLATVRILEDRAVAAVHKAFMDGPPSVVYVKDVDTAENVQGLSVGPHEYVPGRTLDRFTKSMMYAGTSAAAPSVHYDGPGCTSPIVVGKDYESRGVDGDDTMCEVLVHVLRSSHQRCLASLFYHIPREVHYM